MFKDIAFKVVIEVGFKLAILLIGLLYCSTTYYHSRYVPVIQNNTNSVICFDTHTGKTWVADFVVDKADRPYWPAMWFPFIILHGRVDMKLFWAVKWPVGHVIWVGTRLFTGTEFSIGTHRFPSGGIHVNNGMFQGYKNRCSKEIS